MDNGASSYRRFLDGDDYAIGDIIAEYKDGLILYLNSICNNLNTAEEIAEETFVCIAVKQPDFSARSSFKTWLYSIGRHTAVNYMRKHRRFRFVSFQECADIPDITDIESELINNEQKKSLHKAICSLKEDYRQVLYLSYFEDMSNEEIADIMKKKRRQIENLIYNAKKALRFKLEKEGFRYEKF